MEIRKLIHLLEKEYESQDKLRDVFGEPAIAFWVKGEGFTYDFKIARTPDGVIAVLEESERTTQ